jgi:pimeloyl-ACP methyl ester carboxylesterase
MLVLRVNDTDMAYIALGDGPPLVCIHGSLGDFRSWNPVLGPLSRHHRVIVPSLRHFFPEAWDGKGGNYSIPQHTADVIAFIGGLKLGPVNLMGHSRGGHIAFRVAGARPDLVKKLILAEPGGELDASLMPAGPGITPEMAKARTASIVDAAAKIAAGDIDGGLELFVDRIDGPGTWAKRPAAAKQARRDNAHTLVGQINEQRKPFSRADAQAIHNPTLLIGGAKTPGMLPIVLKALAGAIPGAKCEIIPDATHVMFDQAPMRYCEIVVDFLKT